MKRTFLPAMTCSLGLLLPAFTIFMLLMVCPAAAETNSSVNVSATSPQLVNVTIYVEDFRRFDVAAGSVGVDFYLNLKSNGPVSITDLELMNGVMTSITPLLDTPNEKEYRVIAVLTAEPNLSRYPFDRHTLAIRMEPKLKDEQKMILAVDTSTSGLNEEAHIPGWHLTGSRSFAMNHSFFPGEIPYSRVVFDFGIERGITSTLLKFFLPIMLIILVSLSSLMMKTSSRLGLNASMFLAAVLIHWRIADDIPVVPYATFLDIFMIITYATLVMVLLSGIFVLKFTESGNAARVQQINYWSIRVIPPITITLFFLLFLSLLF